LVIGQERQVCQSCSGGDIGMLSKGNHIADKVYPIFHFRIVGCSTMLAKLNRAVT
jgi:hypothetical protein